MCFTALQAYSSIDFVFRTSFIIRKNFLPWNETARLVETNVFYCFKDTSSSQTAGNGTLAFILTINKNDLPPNYAWEYGADLFKNFTNVQ